MSVCVSGGVQKPQKKNLIEDPKGTLGISDQFGFTKKNEVSEKNDCAPRSPLDAILVSP